MVGRLDGELEGEPVTRAAGECAREEQEWPWLATRWQRAQERYTLPVLVWCVADAAGGATIGVFLAFGSPSQVLAALVLAGAWCGVDVVASVGYKWWQWRRSWARMRGRCPECAWEWAGRREFVAAHRENERSSVVWWRLSRLPDFCPHCLHEL